MGGNGGTIGIHPSPIIQGTHLSPQQKKSARNSEADMILSELHQEEATQLIIRRSFRNGIATISIDEENLPATVPDSFILKIDNMAKEITAQMESRQKTYDSFSDFETAQAQNKADAQALEMLDFLIRRYRK